MPRLSTLSNPTGLIDLERQRIAITVDDAGSRLAFSLTRLDLSRISLPSPLNVVVIARRGNSEERVELGPVSEWSKGFQNLSEISADGAWVFRVLLVQPGAPRLVAAAENVRPDGQSESSSFIALEPADLQQKPWEIQILEADGRAVIRFHKEIYLSAGAAEADAFFMGMILPEAIRRVAEFVAPRPSVLDEAWIDFKHWLQLHGLSDSPGDGEDARQEWCADVVGAFCDRFEFASKLKSIRTKGTDE